MNDPIEPWPLLKRDSQGHPIPALQDLLRARGHMVLADGIFGQTTESAVKSFQAAERLSVDGIVGPQTWGALIIDVSEGAIGDAVRAIQEEFQFRNLSGDPGKGLQVDGIFGPKTDAAVRGFQQALGIPADGIIGPLTWRALVSGMLSF